MMYDLVSQVRAARKVGAVYGYQYYRTHRLRFPPEPTEKARERERHDRRDSRASADQGEYLTEEEKRAFSAVHHAAEHQAHLHAVHAESHKRRAEREAAA